MSVLRVRDGFNEEGDSSVQAPPPQVMVVHPLPEPEVAPTPTIDAALIANAKKLNRTYGRRHLVKIAAASTRRVEMLTSENLQEVFDGTNDTKELACARALCSKLLKPPGPSAEQGEGAASTASATGGGVDALQVLQAQLEKQRVEALAAQAKEHKATVAKVVAEERAAAAAALDELRAKLQADHERTRKELLEHLARSLTKQRQIILTEDKEHRQRCLAAERVKAKREQDEALKQAQEQYKAAIQQMKDVHEADKAAALKQAQEQHKAANDCDRLKESDDRRERRLQELEEEKFKLESELRGHKRKLAEMEGERDNAKGELADIKKALQACQERELFFSGEAEYWKEKHDKSIQREHSAVKEGMKY